MTPSKETIRIPVVARMVQDDNGKWIVDEAHSEWADISADTFARFLLDKFGAATIFGEEVDA